MHTHNIHSKTSMINMNELTTAISYIITDSDIDVDLDDLNATSIIIADMVNCMDDTLNIIPEEVLVCIHKIFDDAEDILNEIIDGDVKLDTDIIVPTAAGLSNIPECIIQIAYNNISKN